MRAAQLNCSAARQSAIGDRLDFHSNHGHPQRQVFAGPVAWAVYSHELSICKAADRLGISFHTLDNWIRRGRPKRTVQVPSGSPKTLAEAAARVRSLEADVRRLTLEREILKSRRRTLQRSNREDRFSLSRFDSRREWSSQQFG